MQGPACSRQNLYCHSHNIYKYPVFTIHNYLCCMGFLCTRVKLLTDLQILSCKLHKNAFGGRVEKGEELEGVERDGKRMAGREREREGAEGGDRVGKWDGGLGLDFVQGTPVPSYATGSGTPTKSGTFDEGMGDVPIHRTVQGLRKTTHVCAARRRCGRLPDYFGHSAKCLGCIIYFSIDLLRCITQTA